MAGRVRQPENAMAVIPVRPTGGESVIFPSVFRGEPMETPIQTFEASDDEGTTHTLHVYQEHVPTGTRANPNATDPGMKRILTANGLSVNRRGKGEYEIVQTGQLLRSSVPDAP